MTETERRLRTLENSADRRAASVERLRGLNISEHIAPVYQALHDDIKAGGHVYYNLPGGRGSGKSSFAGFEIVAGIMEDPTGQTNAIIFRQTASTLRESAYSQISWTIDALGVGDLWRGNVSPMSYTYTPTGAQILFRGLDDTGKIKSIKPRRGSFRYIWFEEFSELAGPNFVRSIEQSVVRGGDDFIIFRTFNPPINKNNWANEFILIPDEKAITQRTTYLDLPAEWLGQTFIDRAEQLREINPTAYQHEYLGEATGDGSEVFPNITTRTITDDEINEIQYTWAGVDFGFSVDPAVFVRVSYDRKHDTVIFMDEIYKRHCSNEDLADEIRKLNKRNKRSQDSTYFSGYYEKRERIICDCAEPKSINDLRNAGLQVSPCKKYPGSVLYGIQWLQHRRLVMDPQRTPHCYDEFSNYQYERTRDGHILADVPDAANHTIDATRYALGNLINDRKISA